jgi:hypothetical protein
MEQVKKNSFWGGRSPLVVSSHGQDAPQNQFLVSFYDDGRWTFLLKSLTILRSRQSKSNEQFGIFTLYVHIGRLKFEIVLLGESGCCRILYL